jgi:hypothetical protein
VNRAALVNAVVSISLRRPDLTLAAGPDPLPNTVRHRERPPGLDVEQAQAASRLLADDAIEAIPNAAYLHSLEAPNPTVQLVRDLWAQRTEQRGSGSDQRDKTHPL